MDRYSLAQMFGLYPSSFADRFADSAAFEPDANWDYYNREVFRMASPPTFDDVYPHESNFPPQNDTFADRFYFSSPTMDLSWGVNGAADGGRHDYYAHYYDF